MYHPLPRSGMELRSCRGSGHEQSCSDEALRKKDLEILCIVDSIDEYCVQQLEEFDGKNLTKEGLDIADEDVMKEILVATADGVDGKGRVEVRLVS